MSPIYKHNRHSKKIQTTAVFSVLIWHNLIGVPVLNVPAEFTEVPFQQGIVQERVEPEVVSQILAVVPESDQSVTSAEDVEFLTRLQIPSIGVNAPILNVGLAADGSMDVPKNAFSTGWYELGPKPGEMGSAVITGHVDSPTRVRGVFADLDHLVIGDIIIVENEKRSFTFQVREVRIYTADADATDVFTSQDGKAHLNLITCSGTWDKNTNQYTDRLVIFADKV